MKSNFLRIFASLAVLSLLLPSSSIQARQSIASTEEPAQESVSDIDPMLPEGLTSFEWQSIQKQIMSNLSQQAYLKASNTDRKDYFGYSVAVSNDTIVVGAPKESSAATGINGNQNDNSASYAGAAYVFVRNGNTWTQQAYLKASNTNAGDSFGDSVAISNDTIVVGAVGESSAATGINGNQNDNSASYAGAAYVFVRSGNTWTQQAYLKASNTGAWDRFGFSVAISNETIVVGAYSEDSAATGVNGNQSDNSASWSGAAYVFVRNGSTWTQQAYLKASNTNAKDEFGFSVAVSDNKIVVGAPFEASAATGVNGDQNDNSASRSGAAYVFVRNGSTWTQQAYLKASNTNAEDNFGFSVAISNETIVVGAYHEASAATGVNGNQSDNSAYNAGAAYVFVRDGATWTQQAYLKASNTFADDIFGDSVAISNDTIIVGAPFEASAATGVNGDQNDDSANYAGAAYVFVRDDATWTQQAYLKASNTDAWDEFGFSATVSNDTIVVGAPFEASAAAGVNGDQNDNSAEFAGAAYVFDSLDQFCPNPDGYSFRNADLGAPNPNDLTISDLVQMFGEEAVCESIVHGTCIPKAQARAWIKKMLSVMNGGRCEGMSVTALRYFAGIDSYNNYSDPFSLNMYSTVQRAFGYQTSPVSVRNNIAFFHTLQVTSPVKRLRESSKRDSLSTITQQIIQGLNGPKDGLLNINIFNINLIKGCRGHALTPYAVIDKGDGVFWIKVYDNNYPGSFDRHVIIDTIRETWEYDLGGKIGIWRGNRYIKTIAVIPLSAYSENPTCPWCRQTLQSNTAEQQIFFNGAGTLLITDSQGRRLGYAGETLYEEIPGAYVDIVFGGLGIDEALLFSLPVTDEYILNLTGPQVKQTGEANFVAFGPGYAANLKNIQVNSQTNDSIIISTDGTSISYLPNQNQTATLSSAVDTVNGSWELQVNGMPLTIGQQNTLTVNTISESFTLNANNDSAEYDIYIMRSSSDGLEMYVHGAVPKNSGEIHTIRFGVFKDQNIVILDIDRDGDGVIDESIPLENQVKNLYLPLVFK